MRGCRTLDELLRQESGATAIEFAIVSSVFFTFVIGIAYVGIILFNNMSLDYAVETAARTVALNNSATESQIANNVNAYLTSAGLPAATVEYTTSTIDNVLTGHIVADYSQAYTLPFVSTFHLQFSADAYVPLQSVIQS